VSYHDPRLPSFDPRHDTGEGQPLESVALGAALDAEPDCVVIVTPHAEIDWERVFERASLIVDTRDVSHGRNLRPRQVLRLGAGWS
jgi:UDP-N-acetyl-D-mannosaminuronate dehydrogenase